MKTLFVFCFLIVNLISYSQLDSTALIGLTLGGINNAEETFIDNENNAWILYANSTNINSNGVRKFDGAVWTTFQTSNSGLPNNKAYAIAQDVDSNIWIGTNGGLTKYKNAIWTVYNTSNSGLPSNTITSLLVDDTILWIGTSLGITKYDGQNWTNYLIQNSFYTSVTCLEKHTNTIYGGTEWGIVTLDSSGLTNYSGFAVDIGNKAHRVLFTNDFGIVYQNTEGIYQFANGVFKEFSEVLGLCRLSDFTLTGTSKKKYITKNQWGGISINHGNKITELKANGYRDLVLQSNSGILLNTNGKYYFLKFSGSNYRLYSYAYDSLVPSMQPYSDYSVVCSSQRLNINQVNASILDRGDMFFDVATGKPKYEVPKGSNSHASFANSLWIGGKVNNQLRTACQTYRQSGVDFWPGLLDTVSAINPSLGIGEGTVASVTTIEIQDFIFNYNNGNVQNATFIPARGILDWPANGTGNFSRKVAPYVDVNTNGIYDPLTGGDYPIIKGDQMLYQVYNDASGQHLETGSAGAMGLEVRKKSYAYNCSNLADSLKAINYTTFYEFEIINRSDTLIDSMYVGYWNDVDLGNYQDDYIGCNVKENYAYVYNGDNYDDDGSGGVGYHENSPCFSTVLLKSPKVQNSDGKDNDHDGQIDEIGEEIGMSSFLNFNNTADSKTGNPNTSGNGIQFYRYMKGLWRDGSKMKYGTDGLAGTITTTYQFPGTSDPTFFGTNGVPVTPTNWNEVAANSMPGERRFVIGSGPLQLQPKDTLRFSYALVFTQDSLGVLDTFNVLTHNIIKNEAEVKKIKAWYLNNSNPICSEFNSIGIKYVKPNELSANVYPNPTSGLITIETEDFNNSTKLVITDLLGKTLVNKQMNAQREIINMSQYESGIYFIKVYDNLKQKTIKIIKS
jgi:hypothetical protein